MINKLLKHNQDIYKRYQMADSVVREFKIQRDAIKVNKNTRVWGNASFI